MRFDTERILKYVDEDKVSTVPPELTAMMSALK